MSELKVNTISEVTGANGVTVDGLSIKDSKLVTANSVIEANMSANSVDSDSYVDGSIDTAHIADLNVTTGKIAADAITGAKIADDAINSEHYTDGSIDTAHIADLNVTTGKIAADAITGAKIADDAINSEHYTDGSIDTAHIADGNVTIAKLNIPDGTELSTRPASGDELIIYDASASANRSINYANFASGKVLQVINAESSTETASSSTTYADSSLTAAITPSASSSKVLVIVSQVGLLKNSSDNGGKLRLLRGSTALKEFENDFGRNGGTGLNIVGGASCNFLDSPNTTSATTYKTQVACSVSSNASVAVQHNSAVSTITLMEIGA
jgi:hypothetical protein